MWHGRGIDEYHGLGLGQDVFLVDTRANCDPPFTVAPAVSRFLSLLLLGDIAASRLGSFPFSKGLDIVTQKLEASRCCLPSCLMFKVLGFVLR